MKKLIIPVIIVLVVIGAYVALNKPPDTQDNTSDGSDIPTGNQPTENPPTTDETPTEP